MSFWKKLPKPFFALAPMADVSDAAFRRIIAKYSRPDAMFTEFVSADGLILAPSEGKKKLLADLIFSESERPIVAQFFTSRPKIMERAAALAVELGFDGVDINMGCPDKSIEKQKAGAALMKDPKQAKELIAGAIRGAGKLPVSVKTRIGYNKDELNSWLPHLLETDLAAITIHARTRKEMSSVPAHWDAVSRAVSLRDAHNPKVLIVGNGDVKDLEDAKQKIGETKADGIMLGKAIFGNPFLFSDLKKEKRPPGPEETEGPTTTERLRVMIEHTKLFEELLPHKSFAIMKKHYKAYVSGFEGAAELRAELMNATDAASVENAVEAFTRRR